MATSPACTRVSQPVCVGRLVCVVWVLCVCVRSLSSVELCDVLSLGRWPRIFVVPPLKPSVVCGRQLGFLSYKTATLTWLWNNDLKGRLVNSLTLTLTLTLTLALTLTLRGGG